MKDETTLYSAMVEFEGDAESYVQVFWAYGRTIGEAKSKMEEAIRKNFEKSGVVSEIDPVEGEPQFDEKDDNGMAMWKSTRHWYPKDYSFRLPDGVIKSCLDGEYDLHQIVPGYVIHGGNSPAHPMPGMGRGSHGLHSAGSRTTD